MSRLDGCASKIYWRARCSIGTADGTPSEQIDAVGITKTAAEANLRAKIVRYKADREIAPPVVVSSARQVSGITLAEYCAEWLEVLQTRGSSLGSGSLDAPELSTASVIQYSRVVTLIAEDEIIGGLDLSIVTPLHLRTFLNQRVAVKNEDTGVWSRTSYVKTAHMILRMIFDDVVSTMDIRSTSPMTNVPLPKLPKNRVKQAARPITIEQYGRLRDSVLNQPRHSDYLLPLLDTIAGLGIRIGEALALTRGDLNWMFGDAPIVRVSGHIVPGETKAGWLEIRVPGLKEAQAAGEYREIDTPAFVVAALSEQLARVLSKSPDALVFSTRTGAVVAASNIRRTLRVLAKRADIPQGVSPHSFRKLLANEVNHHRKDGGKSSAQAMGNTIAVANRHYITREVRRTSPEIAAIAQASFAEIMPDRSS
ncbi:tyrosine-type recombinase/integrase [Lacisediminihabitans sp. FW035]